MIELSQVTKKFSKREVVSNLNLKVNKGEVLGFLGPNGAGKSTTMKMITGFLSPSQGRISILGVDIEKYPIRCRASIGYLAEGVPLYPDMQVNEFLNFIADIRQLRGQKRRTRLQETLEQMALKEVLFEPIANLSKGFLRRVGLAQAILHDPEILILDEPTDGLDPNQKHHVRQLIRELTHRKLVIVSTHILEEVSAVCTRAVIIHQGKKLVDDTPQGLEARSKYFRAVSMRFDPKTDMSQVINSLSNHLVGFDFEQDDEWHIRLLSINKDNMLPKVSELVRLHGWLLDDLYVEAGRLDEVFRTITSGNSLNEIHANSPIEQSSEVA